MGSEIVRCERCYHPSDIVLIRYVVNQQTNRIEVMSLEARPISESRGPWVVKVGF